MLSIPLLGLAFFAGKGILTAHQLVAEMNALQQLVELSVHISTFIHESQKERGITGVFLGSKGEKFRSELSSQRAVTDKQASMLTDLFGRFDAKQFGAHFQSLLETARRDYYDKLTQHRAAVDALGISGPDGVGFYTKMHAAFLDAVMYMASLSTNAELSSRIMAYANFLKVKEFTGVERAVGANAFAAGRFANIEELNKFVGVTATQEAYLKIFFALVSQGQKAFYLDTLKGPAVEEAARMRQIALQSMDTGNMGGIEGSVWFRTMTEKINLMKSVEEQLSGELLTKAAELQRKAQSEQLFFLGLLVCILAVTLGVSWFIARLIAVPLRRTALALRDVAEGEGDLTRRLQVESRDEVGEVALWFNVFIEKIQRTIQHIGQTTQTLAGASEELTAVSQQMSASSEETAAQAGVVSAASEQVSRNIQTVTASAEEMAASIKEIAKNASEAARVTAQAVQMTEGTNTTITKLGESSAEVGEVIKVITSIAEQTNLLALNATIEAARAGEAGKGFAVVANEVKELAKQTAEATENISHKIGAIQSDAQDAVGAIGRISGIINQINDIASTIASAVEEQSVTTAEMGRNVEEASKGGAEIAQNIGGVAQAAQSTASGATETQASAQELARMAVELRHLVSQFKYDEVAHDEATQSRKVTVGMRPMSNGHTHDTAQL
jgi:methyl-accepting chemotaxis protein